MTVPIPTSTKFQILIKYFMDKFPFDVLTGKDKPKTWEEKRALFYFERILELDSVLKKIEKYPAYFENFYPSPEVLSKSEAIEYHWHSYLHDVYILKERVSGLIGSLKNDLPRYNLANPDDAIKLLNHLKTQAMKGLESAAAFRSDHTHHKTARNFDLTRANTLHLIKENSASLGLDPKKLDDKIVEFTEKSKNDFVTIAKNNNTQMEKLRNFLAPRLGYLFASLNGHDYSMFTMD